jgi:hypothetical protein
LTKSSGEQLITLNDIKLYKLNNFEEFPEYFYTLEDWKVVFFSSKELQDIVSKQLNPNAL